MNTFSYLSTLIFPSSSPAPVASTSILPQQQTSNDSDHDEILEQLTNSSETLYLSARRNSVQGASPHVTISRTPPPHLVGVGLPGNANSSSQISRRASVKGKEVTRSDVTGQREEAPEADDVTQEKVEQVVQDTGEAEEWDEKKEPIPIKLEEQNDAADDEDSEAERRLALKRKKLILLETGNLNRIWPIRVGVQIFVFLRQIFSLVGIGFRPRSNHNKLLAPPRLDITPTNDNELPATTTQDELFARLQNSTGEGGENVLDSTNSRPKRNSFFFRKATADDSQPATRTPSPIRAPRQPPRLTPKTLVLDLDETLIHSTSRPYASNKRSAGLKVRLVEVVLEGRSTVYTVYKRPWVDFFLRKVSSWYTVIIFTASLPEYADPVIDWLDGGDGGGGMVGGRLFRSDCLHSNGSYVKDLSVVDSDLSRVCLVDNSPVSYAINQANGIPIEGWINDPNDECLLDLLPMLDSLRFTNDVRRVLGLRGFGSR